MSKPIANRRVKIARALTASMLKNFVGTGMVSQNLDTGRFFLGRTFVGGENVRLLVRCIQVRVRSWPSLWRAAYCSTRSL